MGASGVGSFVDKTIGAGIDVVEGHQKKKQKQKEINAQLASQRNRFAVDKEKELLQRSQYTTDQKNLLKRALATQKARYGAGGTGIKSNSAKSVLGRMKTDAKRSINDYSDLSDLRLKQLKNNASTAETNALLSKKRVDLDKLFGEVRAGHQVIGGAIKLI